MAKPVKSGAPGSALTRALEELIRPEVPSSEVAHAVLDQFKRAERRIAEVREEIHRGIRPAGKRFRI